MYSLRSGPTATVRGLRNIRSAAPAEPSYFTKIPSCTAIPLPAMWAMMPVANHAHLQRGDVGDVHIAREIDVNVFRRAERGVDRGAVITTRLLPTVPNPISIVPHHNVFQYDVCKFEFFNDFREFLRYEHIRLEIRGSNCVCVSGSWSVQ